MTTYWRTFSVHNSPSLLAAIERTERLQSIPVEARHKGRFPPLTTMGRTPSRRGSNLAPPTRTSEQQEEHNRLLDSAISRLEAEIWSFSPVEGALSQNDQDSKSRQKQESQEEKGSQGDEEPLYHQVSYGQAGNPPDGATVGDLMRHVELEFHNEIMVAAGLSFFSDGIDIVATYFLALPFQDETNWQSEIIASSIFVGMMVGSFFMQWCGELFGKRAVFCASSLLRPVLGCLTLVAYDFPSLVVLRFLVGFVAAGRLVAFQVLDEFSTKARPNIWIYMQFFWSAGVILVSVAESITSPNSQLMIISTEVFVLISSIVGILWIPESPSWLVRRGDYNKALLVIGDISGPAFDWLVAIQPNVDPPQVSRSAFMEQWRISGIWMGFGMLYYGGMYSINTIFHGNDVYYGTIVASAEMGVLGIFIGWYGVTKIGTRWTQIIGFFLGGLSVTLVESLKDDPAIVVSFAILGRLCLMAAITASLSYAMAENLATPLAFCAAQLGAVEAPFLIDGPQSITIGCLVLQTIFVVACAWSLPEKKRIREENKEAVTMYL